MNCTHACGQVFNRGETAVLAGKIPGGAMGDSKEDKLITAGKAKVCSKGPWRYGMDYGNGGIKMTKRILDRSFKYVPASHTNIRKTFARIRRDLSKQKVEADRIRAEQQTKVASIRLLK